MTRNGAVFGFCLLLAFMLLLLNKLSRKYISPVKARIQYVHLPEGRVPTTPLPNKLQLFIETTGFKLVWTKLRKPAEVEINLADVKTDYVVTADLKSVIASQLSTGYNLIEIIPDTLYFNFAKGIKKKVPVTPDILISFKKQHDFMDPMLIKPDSVLLSGPENILDTIKGWRTERIMFDNLDHSVQDDLALVPPSS